MNKQRNTMLKFLTLLFLSQLLNLFAASQSKLELSIFMGRSAAEGGMIKPIGDNRFILAEINDGLVFSGRLTGFIGPYFGFDLSLSQSTNKHRASIQSLLKGEGAINETTGIGFLDLNILFRLLPGSISPYVTVGTGMTPFVNQAPFSFNIGGGLRVGLDRRLALRTEARIYWINLQDALEEVGLDPYNWKLSGATYSYQESIRFVHLILGFVYRF